MLASTARIMSQPGAKDVGAVLGDALHEEERSSALIRALDSTLEERHIGFVQLDSRGDVAHASCAAREMLEAYFNLAPGSGATLPDRLRAWLAAERPTHENGSARTLTVEGPRGHLRIRAPDSATATWRTVILEEQRASPPTAESLRSLGLTSRQAQVLRLLACGKASRQIAAELHITTATVSKHLEHIYGVLGVSTRAEAIARTYTTTRTSVGDIQWLGGEHRVSREIG
jgi:DNA-binding CsgD family transcriptional regulator